MALRARGCLAAAWILIAVTPPIAEVVKIKHLQYLFEKYSVRMRPGEGNDLGQLQE